MLMQASLPLFPLNLVAYPFEEISLHIFEPRYRQLIRECLTEGITFGIPAYLEDRLHDFGTEMQVTELVNDYPDGRMDIRAVGLVPFQIEQMFNPMPGKLYAGGMVRKIPMEEDTSGYSERLLLTEKLRQVGELLNMQFPYGPDDAFISFRVGHKVGLSSIQEYHLLTFEHESQRINFLLDHLSRSLPILEEMERTRRRIRLNGHFRYLDPLKF